MAHPILLTLPTLTQSMGPSKKMMKCLASHSCPHLLKSCATATSETQVKKNKTYFHVSNISYTSLLSVRAIVEHYFFP